ncbi:Mariner Mos1 transposase [Acromyrmex echinatior]|uniref:Mariner Mos1 transposase n=1 Tax=Acromyrmex echinatior TaxID=103372 RepID=F4WA04_ACREC|nr:Mariner Mos1 transposase [Acromyrmex echinatior]
MPSFEPNKRHLRKLLIYFFNLKKSAAETHRLLVKAYGERNALSERNCREWFQKFKNGEFDVEDKERSGKPKVYEDAELETLLNENLCQTQKEMQKVTCTYIRSDSTSNFISINA